MDYEVRSNSTSGIFAGQNLGTKGDYQVHPKQQGPHEGQRRIMSGETTVAHSLSQNTPFSTPRRDTSSYVSHSRTYPVMLLQRALSVAGRAKTRPSSNPENETPKTKLRTRTVARRRRYARYRTASQGPSNTLQPCTTQTLTVNPSFPQRCRHALCSFWTRQQIHPCVSIASQKRNGKRREENRV